MIRLHSCGAGLEERNDAEGAEPLPKLTDGDVDVHALAAVLAALVPQCARETEYEIFAGGRLSARAHARMCINPAAVAVRAEEIGLFQSCGLGLAFWFSHSPS